MHRRVEQGGDGHGHRVGRERTENGAPGQEEEEIAERADQSNAREAQQLVGRDLTHLGALQILGPTHEHAPNAAQVIGRGRHDVHARVGVVDPVHRYLTDAQTEPLRDDEELGVEEPLVVLDEREDALGRISPQGLEAALGVTETTAQRHAEDEVVRPRDELALRTSHDAGTAGEPRADGHVAMAGEQRCHERKQRLERGRQVHVHVGDDGGAARRPCLAQGEAPALAVKMQGRHAGQGVGQGGGHRIGVVVAGVVDDGDDGAEGEGFIEEGAQRDDAHGQLWRFVVDGDDDFHVDGGAPGIHVHLVGGQGCHALHGAGVVSALREAQL